jgi:hypothetical protein
MHDATRFPSRHKPRFLAQDIVVSTALDPFLSIKALASTQA